jgi:hypothetical protein
MNRIKHWLAAAGLAIAGLFGYHATIPETSVIEVQTPPPIASTVEPVETSDPHKRIMLGCDATCSNDEKNELALIALKTIETEATKCFTDRLQGVDPEQINGLTVEQAIHRVTTASVDTTITYYYQSMNWFTKTLVIGFENGDGFVHANRAAWDYMDICEKASNIGHEISHGEPLNFSQTAFDAVYDLRCDLRML